MSERWADGVRIYSGGLNSFFFAFANIIIHSIFNTDSRDWTVNSASSYLDLSPLYGSSEVEVDGVRREYMFADLLLLGWMNHSM